MYGRKTISPRCSMKIDLHKVFDSLDWRFISVVLKAIQLPHQFIAWIEECFTQARYSIAFNGTLIGYFKEARGLRQGDPLSPYLFVLAMNILTRMLNLAANKRIFGFHPKCNKLGLTHFSFTDDLLIFCKGNVDSVVGVISELDQFHQFSGLKLNSSKFELFAVGIPIGITEKIKRIYGFKIGSLSVKYLGIPLVSPKLTDKDCEALIINIKQRLQIWWSSFAPISSGNELIKRLLELELAGHEDSCWKRFPLGSMAQQLSAFPLLTAGMQTKDIWEITRTHDQKVSWHRLIWFPLHVPKHSLIAWTVLLDRLQRMGICSEGICINCNFFQESRYHLFFHCPLAAELWNSFLQLNGMNSTLTCWDDFIASACSTWKGKSLITVILKLAWSAFTYFLWQERNSRIFLGRRRNVEALLKEIKDVVGIRLRGEMNSSTDGFVGSWKDLKNVSSIPNKAVIIVNGILLKKK
ncbi:uncharacterized protein LOC120149065 [Hibiscus syriacus]|uniref:uncharacterized protein LOC120149065 n=1 Tax=Hibiscus syriacus TaxID=106335 RepID=UPI001921C767|nr:uncharacterized protein LOC120149065 [Hibiscus syriacus]